jgi:hypothetical protein
MSRQFLVLGVLGVASACFDARELPSLDYGVDIDDVWADGAPQPIAAGPGERRIVVTNNLDDTVSIVSWSKLLAGDDDAEISRFPVGLVPLEREGPHHVSVDAAGRYAFVGISNYVPGAGSGPHGMHGGGTADGRVLRIDLDTQRTVTVNRVDKNPGDIRLTPDGTTLVVSHFDLVKINTAAAAGVFTGPTIDATLGFLDANTLERGPFISLCPAPHGVAMTSDSRSLISSCLSDEAAIVDMAAVLAGATTDVVVRIPLLDEPGTAAGPVCSPYATTLSPDDSTAWISCYRSGEIIAVDVTRKERGGSIAMPGLAVFGDYADTSNRFAIATQDTDGIVVLVDNGAGTASIERFMTVDANHCIKPHTVLWLDNDAHLAVVCEGNKLDAGSLIVVDPSSGVELAYVGLGLFPDDIALQVKP